MHFIFGKDKYFHGVRIAELDIFVTSTLFVFRNAVNNTVSRILGPCQNFYAYQRTFDNKVNKLLTM